MLTITRTYPVPPDRVFDAWTRPEQFARWFGTEDVDVPRNGVTMDVRPGGRWTFSMQRPNGETASWGGQYAEVQRPKRLAFTIRSGSGIGGVESILVTFTAVGSKTRVNFAHSATDVPDDVVDRRAEQFTYYFDALGRLLMA